MKKGIKPIYIHVPEREYRAFKIFAFKNHLSLQRLIRHATLYYIKKAQESKD